MLPAGRGEIDDTQELNYPAIMRALLAVGYQGYVAHEVIPPGPIRWPLCGTRYGCATCETVPRSLPRAEPRCMGCGQKTTPQPSRWRDR